MEYQKYLSSKNHDYIITEKDDKTYITDINSKKKIYTLNTSYIITDEESLFIDISFKSTNPEEAKILVNAFTQLAPGYTEEILPSVKVEILDEADSTSSIYPRTLSSTFIFGVLGAIVTCIIIVLIATLDQAIKNEEDFASTFDIPVLGTVPDFENSPTYAYRTKTGNASAGGH